jgi:hypothetical protein
MSKYLTIIIVLTALTASAQTSKTRQVDESLGTRIREIPAQGDRIEYVFQTGRREQTYHRTGDGRSDYTTLLQKTSGLGDYNDEGGTLLYVKKNGEVVARGNAVGTVAETHQPANRVRSLDPDPMRPQALTQEQDGGFSMPDSMQVAESLHGAERQFDAMKARFWATIQPIWRFVAYVFTSLLWPLVCLIGLCRYITKSAANESLVTRYGRVVFGRLIVRTQENAAAFTLFMSWILFGALLIDLFLWIVLLDMPIWSMIVVWFPALWVAEKLTDWIVPNPNVVGSSGDKGNYPSPYGG